MSFVTNRKRTPPLSPMALDLMNLLAKAQTVGARRALALMVKAGKLDDGRALSQHWAAKASAVKEYDEAKEAFIAKYGPP